jgi:four helix bundle protein
MGKVTSVNSACFAQQAKFFREMEIFGLTGQMRRASASIGMNIVEGRCRKGDAEMAGFPQIAMGSASELEYKFLLAHDLEYLHNAAYECLTAQAVEVKKMLSSLMQKVKVFN